MSLGQETPAADDGDVVVAVDISNGEIWGVFSTVGIAINAIEYIGDQNIQLRVFRVDHKWKHRRRIVNGEKVNAGPSKTMGAGSARSSGRSGPTRAIGRSTMRVNAANTPVD